MTGENVQGRKRMKQINKSLVYRICILLGIVLAGPLVGCSSNTKLQDDEELKIGGFLQQQTLKQIEEESADVKEDEFDPDSFSQAVHYDGYLDESPYTMWNRNWNYCDFDEDGEKDRVYREVTDTDIAYRIDFGNGDVLELARSEDFFMGIKIQTADVCGLWEKEILFVGQHMGSTDPTAESDIYLYQKTYNGYKRILLPNQREEADRTTGFEVILSDLDDECVKLECPDAGYEEVYAWDTWSGWDDTAEHLFEFSGEPVVTDAAYDAAFIEYAGDPKLVLYQNAGGKWVFKETSFILNMSRWEDEEGRHEFTIQSFEMGRNEGKTVDELIEEYSSVQVPDDMAYISAYLDVIRQYTEEYEESRLQYNLIYFDEDKIPELALGVEGYWVSLFTYQDGAVYELMDQWGYGAFGNAGYEYLPYGNVIRNYNTDYAGLVLYESYDRMDENFELEGGFWLKQAYLDSEGNIADYDESTYDENNWHYYYEDTEISAEEYDFYAIRGEFEYINTDKSVSEIIAELYAPLLHPESG